MLLAIDIGNTNISLALFKKGRMSRVRDIPLNEYTQSKLFNYCNLRGVHACTPRRLKQVKERLDTALICSVVPRMTNRLANDLKKITKIKPKLIGKDILIPLKNLYQNPKQLGQDRLVNAYAASRIYSTPVIIVSCGTAITIDVVSKNKVYLGGFILPGLNLALSALNAKTALLPKIALVPAPGLIGKDTKSGILNGVIMGNAGAIDALIKRIEFKTGRNTKVIGTGGDIDLVKKFSKYVKKIDKELTLKGISLLNKNYFSRLNRNRYFTCKISTGKASIPVHKKRLSPLRVTGQSTGVAAGFSLRCWPQPKGCGYRFPPFTDALPLRLKKT